MKTKDTPARRVACTLSAMYGRGTITSAMVEAGRRFQQQWDAAHSSAGIMRYDIDANGIRQQPATRQPDRPRDRLEVAMRALGGVEQPAGRVAWYVLGKGEPLREFATWTQQRPQDASAHLVAALGVLVGHYWPEVTAMPAEESGCINCLSLLL